MELYPYLLRPDAPAEGTPRPGGGAELQEPLLTYAREAGLEKMRRPPLVAFSHLALEASEYAREKGLILPFHRAAYQAYWEAGQNIGDLKVLEGLARQAGLDWEELLPKLERRSYQSRVTAQYQQALEMGIRGIPAFLIGRYLFTGAQPYPLFQRVLQQAQKDQIDAPQPTR